jgi:hypothetical protein
MKKKLSLIAGIVLVSTFGLAPSPALADDGVYFVQCDSDNCYVIECTTMPNINDTDWSGHGCLVVDTYPRPREVDGQ